MDFKYKEYLLLRAIFPERTNYVVKTFYVGAKTINELLTNLAVKEAQNLTKA